MAYSQRWSPGIVLHCGRRVRPSDRRSTRSIAPAELEAEREHRPLATVARERAARVEALESDLILAGSEPPEAGSSRDGCCRAKRRAVAHGIRPTGFGCCGAGGSGVVPAHGLISKPRCRCFRLSAPHPRPCRSSRSPAPEGDGSDWGELSEVAEHVEVDGEKSPASLVRAVHGAMAAATGEVVCLMSASAEPLDDSSGCVASHPRSDRVVAATALLVQPTRPTTEPHTTWPSGRQGSSHG